MRYIAQPDQVSCGPIAIMNALKWAGIKITLKDLPKYKLACRAVDPSTRDIDAQGTADADFDRVLRWSLKGKCRVIKKRQPSLKQIIKHLSRGGTFCMAYHWEDGKETGEHFVFVEKIENGLFLIANDHDLKYGNALRKRTKGIVQRWLGYGGDHTPTAWFLLRV